ncbi:MAG: hypothetical protein JST07_06260 [Bacteroidetes bacterium]|nr:hypothetical protein [Bacteroidota bacterium]
MKTIIFLFSILLSVTCIGQQTISVNSEGKCLRDFYIKEDVANKWLSGHHINWETGESDNPNATKGIKTHCSAFVAAACKQLNIYILRPPQHKQELLANAQFDWLNSEDAIQQGWKKIIDNPLIEAERLANEGYVVIASTKNSNSHKPGHIALIIPKETSNKELTEKGPFLIQAAQTNGYDIYLRNGFKSHIKDWNQTSEVIEFHWYKTKVFCR